MSSYKPYYYKYKVQRLMQQLASEQRHCRDLQNRLVNSEYVIKDLVHEVLILRQKAYPTRSLPTDCLVQILKRCEIVDVFRCQLVDREWNYAAALVLKSKKELTVTHSTFDSVGRVYYPVLDSDDIPSLLSMKTGLLKKMTSLEKLFLDDLGSSEAREFAPLILARAATLKVLKLGDYFSDLNGIEFKRLQNLEVWVRDSEMKACFPHLVKLTARVTRVTDWKRLAVQSLKHCLLTFEPENPDVLEAKIRILCSLWNLQSLQLRLHDHNPRVCPRNLTHLFNSFPNLVSLKLEFRLNMESETFDAAIERLVSRSPRLAMIELWPTSATGQTLVSLSGLLYLRELRLFSNSYFREVDVLTLLRGSSREQLRSVSLHHVHMTSALQQEVGSLGPNFTASFNAVQYL